LKNLPDKEEKTRPAPSGTRLFWHGAFSRGGLPHITWRLLRHWGATQMVEANTPIKVVQQRLGHSRPNTVLIYYARVLDKSADSAASLVSGQLSGAPMTGEVVTSIISSDLLAIGSAGAASLPQPSL
jgi:Site-specific recombinase XerD